MIWVPSEVGLEVVVDDRHRHHRPDRPQPAHRLGAGHQPAAQRAGDGREDDVVDRAAVHLADLAVVGELGAHGDEPALLRQRPVHRRCGGPGRVRRGRRRPRRPGAPRGRAPRGRATRRWPRGGRPAACGGSRGCRSPRRATSAAGRGRPPRAPVVVVRPASSASAEVSSSTWPMSTVSRPSTRIWWLLVRSATRPSLEALDEVDLPQRPAAVERPGGDPRDELAQLVHRPGPRQRGAAYVVAEVEVLVVHPDRVGQPAGHRLQPLAVARHEGDPVGDQLRPGGRSRSRSHPGRRSPPSRCASASWGTRRPGRPGPAAAAARSS